MSLTQDYSTLHRAIATVSAQLSGPMGTIAPMDLRVLYAIAEREGRVYTHELQSDLLCEPSALRRAKVTLRNAEFIQGGNHPGMRTPIFLTVTGAEIIKRIERERQRLRSPVDSPSDALQCEDKPQEES